MGEAGRQLVLADHSWTAVANSYMALVAQRQQRLPDYDV